VCLYRCLHFKRYFCVWNEGIFLLQMLRSLHRSKTFHRITESLRLEKTSKIIKSNHQPITTCLLNRIPVCHIYTFFEHLQGWWLHHFPGQPNLTPDHSFSKVIFPDIQSKPSLMQLEAISSRPIAGYLGEETDTCLTTTSFHLVAESNKVSPQPPLLQTKQPQYPQLPLTTLVL